jgi:hypothetical protein
LVLTNTFVGASPQEAEAALRLARASGAKHVGGSLWAGLADLEQQITQLAGADCIWLESATSAEQALEAVLRAVRVTTLPIAITCSLRAAPLDKLRAAGATVAGYNCTPRPISLANADIYKPAADGLLPGDWARLCAGPRFVGGCCGTDARYLLALRATAR